MKDEIIKLYKRITINQEINKGANEMIKNNHTEYFTTAQLRMIAELAADESIRINREARQKLLERETELAECKNILDERFQPLYGGNEE